MNIKIIVIFCLFEVNLLFCSGKLDTTFNDTGTVITNIATTSGTTDVARAVVIDANDNFIVVGTNGMNFVLVRYLSTGIIDTTFGGLGYGIVVTDMTDSTDEAYAVAIDSQQNIVVVGSNGADFAVARYTADGFIDENFNENGKVITSIGSDSESIAYGVAIDSDDNIVVVGTDGDNFVVARYSGTGDNAGKLDSTFGTGGIVTSGLSGSAEAYGVVIQSDGKIVVVGTSDKDFAVARYTTSGVLDSSFNTSRGYVITSISGTDVAYAVKLQEDGKIVVAGKSKSNVAIARYTTDGVLDSSTFGSKKGYVSTNLPRTAIGYSLDITSEGKIIVGGVSSNNFAVAQYTHEGELDTNNFGSGLGYITTDLGSNDVSYGLVIDKNNDILLVGTNKTDFALVQYTSIGTLNTSFGQGLGTVITDIGSGTVDAGRSCAVQADGKIVVIGTSSNKFAIVRYTSTGDLDLTFGTDGKTTTSLSGTSIAYDLAIQSDGKIVVVGTSNGRLAIARYTSDGILDTQTFAPKKGYVRTNLNNNSIAYGVALTSNNKIVVTGVDDNKMIIAQYTTTGVLDTANFGSGDGYVTLLTGMNYGSSENDNSENDVSLNNNDTSVGYSIKINSDDTIIVAGVITTSDDTDFLVAQYTSNGTLDTANFGNGNGYITTDFGAVDTGCSLAILSNKKIIVGGISNGCFALSQYTAAGDLDSTFGVDGKIITEVVNQTVSGFMGLAVQEDGNIIVSATTSSLNGDFITARYLTKNIGILNQNFNAHGLIPGSINMYEELGVNYGQAKQIEFSVLHDVYYIAIDNEVDTQIVSMDSDTNTKNLNFGFDGVLTISGHHDVSDLFVDATGVLNIVGGSGLSGSHEGWIQRYDGFAGYLIASFTPIDFLDVHTSIRQQSSARILVAGQDNGIGNIIAYNSVTGEVDLTFGVDGRYSMDHDSIINNMVIGFNDSIYIVSSSQDNVTIQKMIENGTTVLWSDTISTGMPINLNNHIALDMNETQIICAITTIDQGIILKKYNKINGANLAIVNLEEATTGLSMPIVNSLIVDSNNNILLGGYDSADDATFVIRVLADVSGLDTSFNESGMYPGVQSYEIPVISENKTWTDLHINVDGDVFAIGSAMVSDNYIPYISCFYNDSVVVQSKTKIAIGIPGTMDTTFFDNGICNLSTLSSLFVDNPILDLVTYKDGSYCLALDDGVHSQCMRILKNLTFDEDLSSLHDAPSGVNSIIIDGNDHVLFVGANEIDGGWLHRHFISEDHHRHGDEGDLEFGINGVVAGHMSEATFAVQQTLGRYLVVGKRDNYNVLRAYTLSGVFDTTFHHSGVVPGELIFDYNIYSIVVDTFDRLLFAYKNGSDIEITRLTANGYLDTSFNNGEVIISSIADSNDESQILSILNSNNHIVLAAHVNDGEEKIAVISYDTMGSAVYEQINISGLVNPILTDLVAVQDGGVFVVGYQSGNYPMWVAKITSTGILDTNFGENGDGFITIVVSESIQSERILSALSIRPDGRFMLVGYETDLDGIKYPFLIRMYHKPYKIGVKKFPASAEVGTVDGTLGKSGNPKYTKNELQVEDLEYREGFRATSEAGVTFFASSGADATYNQIARSVALQDVNTVVVAIDGASTFGGASEIFINEFDVNGVPDTGFNGTGQATIPQYYDNEYVRDMVTFTTTDAVNKAILVGYATNSALGTTSSVVWQYDLSNVVLDSTFGGFDGNPSGISFGTGQEAHVVGTQSNGRIIVGGLDRSGNGLIVGYSSNGKLDRSFGSNSSGLFTQGTTGIYTHAIDTENRIVIAYNDGSNNIAVARFLTDGSGLDTSFNSTGTIPGIIDGADRISGISGNSNMNIAVDTNNQVVVVGIVGSTFIVNRYYPDGTITTGSSIQEQLIIAATSLGGTASSLYTISKLLVDTDNKTIITAYDAYPTPNDLIVMRATANLSGFDTTLFNSPDGYIAYQVSTGNTQVGNDALIHPDGRVIVVGFED